MRERSDQKPVFCWRSALRRLAVKSLIAAVVFAIVLGLLTVWWASLMSGFSAAKY